MTATAAALPRTPSRTYPSLRAAWIPLAALCLAFFVEMVDNTLLSIALPTIGRDLGSGTAALQWVIGAYSLTFGGLLLTAGSVADRLGRRRVLLVGPRRVRPAEPVRRLRHHGRRAHRAARRAGHRRRRHGADHQLARVPALRRQGAADARRHRDDRRRHVRVHPRAAARRHRAGPRALGVAAGRQRPDRADRLRRRLARRRGRPRGGPDRRRARPAGRRAERRHDRPGLLLADQRRRARLALRAHGRVDPRCRRRGRRLRVARAPQRVADAGSRPLLERHRPRRRHRADGDVDRHGQRDVRAGAALPVRLRLEPREGRPGEPADHHHHDRRDAALRRSREALRAPHRLLHRRRSSWRPGWPVSRGASSTATSPSPSRWCS